MLACMCVWMADKPVTCVSMMCKLATSTSPARVLQACCAIGGCWLYMCVRVCVCLCACENGTWLVNIVTYVCLYMQACCATDWVFADKVCLGCKCVCHCA